MGIETKSLERNVKKYFIMEPLVEWFSDGLAVWQTSFSGETGRLR